MPDTLFFQTPEEALDHAVAPGRIRRAEFLLQPIVATGRPDTPALKDEPTVGRDDGRPPVGRDLAKRAEQASWSARSASFARPRLVVAHNPATVAVDNSRQIRPTASTAGVRSVAGRSLLRAV